MRLLPLNSVSWESMTVAYLLAFFNIYKDLSEKHELNSLCLEGTLVPHLKKVFFTHLVCKGGARDSARSSEHDLRLGGSQLIFQISNTGETVEIFELFTDFAKSSIQFSSVAQSCPTLCDPMNCSMPGLPVHHQPRSSLRLTSIESVMPSSHLILCRLLLLLPPIPPSNRVFSNKYYQVKQVYK